MAEARQHEFAARVEASLESALAPTSRTSTPCRISGDGPACLDAAEARLQPIAHNLPMEPQVQYAISADGTRIACYKIGQGPPLLEVESLPSHLLVAWQSDFLRRAAERFSQHYTVIKFDRRGSGLSQRGRVSREIDAQAADIAAVLDRLGVERTSIHARGVGAASAIVFAAEHPERVDKLVLWSAFAATQQLESSGQLTGTVELLQHDYKTYTETIANTFLGWAAGDAAREYAVALRAGQTQEEAIASMQADVSIDVRDRLSSVQAPTLVVHVKDSQFPGVQAASELAAAIPNAQLAMVEGDSPAGTTGWASRAGAQDREGGGRHIVDLFLSDNVVPHAPALDAADPAPDQSEATLVPRAPAAKTFASGRYTVRRTLGEGGQKVVYLVHDEALDRDCALSMVKPELLEPEDLERLRREAQAMARLGAHSNIVTVHDIGDEGGKPYLVCEYVPAGELRAELRHAGGPLALERALTIAADIARALAVAHGRGVIHRDVKPANVWLCDDGSAKLGDFGLAFSIDRTRMTIAGTVMGTATYMAPEQARGDPADARTDLYALGVVLYEMVCGRPPFSGDDPLSVISQHASIAPAAPVLHVAGLPPALNDLILRLLAKPPNARPPSAADVLDALGAIAESLRTAAASPEPEASEPEPAPAAPGFVGRAPEQEQLAAALDRAIGGAGSLVMVVGEPGIGKTRLLEQFAAHARAAGASVLVGRCYDGDWAPPFSPFVEAIKQHATTTSPQRLRAHLGADAGVLARIVPALHERLPNIAEPPAIPAEGERYRLLEAVSDTLGRLAAERPLVLVLDDLHWADKGTIAMLQQVARTSATQRVLLLGAYRDVELDRTHPLADALAGLRREKNFERIALRGLDGAEVAELLDTIAEQDVPPLLAEAIARETDGNPFFIKEVLLHLVEEKKIVQEDGTWTSKLSIAEMGIPEGVREVIGRRLSRVSETCGRMLTVASALTAGFSWDVISALMDAGDAALLDAVDEALGAQLIVERQRGRYDFTHALIRHTLYEELSTPRRVLLHRKTGDALERLYAADIESHVAELAHHYEQGEDWRKALQFLMKAGEKAASSYANQDAISFFDRAYQAGQRAGSGGTAALSNAALQRGTVRTTIGDLSAADDFALAASLAREAGDREAEAVALAERGFVLIYAHEFEQAKTTLNEALAIATAHGLEVEYVVRAYLMELFSDWGRLRERDEQFAATEGMSGGADHHRARAFRAMLVTFSAYWDGRFDVAISAHKAAAPQYEAAHDFFARIFGVWVNALAVAHAGHYEDALSAFAHVIAEGERCGDILFPMRTLNCIGWVYGEIENHERALEQNLRGVEAAIAVDLPDPEVEMNARLNAADNLIALGRLDEAADQLRHVERVVRDPLPPERWMLWRYSQHYYHTQGELQLMQRDAETALMLAERCLALAEETKARKNIVKARRLRAQARMALGDLAAAENDIGAALELAIEIANPGQLWRTHEALGDLRRAERRAEDARSAYGDALAVLQQMAVSLADDELRDTLLKSAAVRRLQERTSS